MPQRLLTLGPDNSIHAISLSPDGKSLVFAYRKKQGDSDIWYSSLEKDAQPRPLLTTSFNEAAPRVSPDGHYLAYQSDETGRYEVYVRPYPTGDVRWMISSNGGTNPKWGAKDSEIFYLQDDTLMAVPVHSQPKFQAGIPHPLFSGKAVNSPMRAFDSPLYDPSPDGKRFVIIREADPGPRSIVVQQKWLNNSSDN
jgi:dipeptidyl aminopeptidase/acylaminoacyl peptidase